MTVDIIGAGIGGLTLAIALEQKGISVRVFEQSREIKPVGAGITLAINAMQVYMGLGLKKEIEKNGNPISSMNITGQNLKPLSRVELKYFEQAFDCQNIAIHRARLHDVLINKLKPKKIRLGHKLSELSAYDGQNLLRFENGNEIVSDITIGADGLNSAVRKQIFPKAKIRNANQFCWRGIVNTSLPKEYRHELNEAWGSGSRLGFVQIGVDTVYWYALISTDEESKEILKNDLTAYYSGFDPMIQELISQTPVDSIHTYPIRDLEALRSWFKGNICLMGDAAHATTPNMGQGACQAIEDGYILAECLHRFGVGNAFENFQIVRKTKVKRVVNTSWHIGKMAHWKNPLAIALRNQMMKFTPEWLSKRQSESIFKLESL